MVCRSPAVASIIASLPRLREVAVEDIPEELKHSSLSDHESQLTVNPPASSSLSRLSMRGCFGLMSLCLDSQLVSQLVEQLDISDTRVRISDVEHAALFGEVPQLLIDHLSYEQATSEWCDVVQERLRRQLGSCRALPSEPNAMRRITSLIARCSPSGLLPWPVPIP